MHLSVLRFVLVLLFAAAIIVPAEAQRDRRYPPSFNDADEHVYKVIDDVRLSAWVFRPAGSDQDTAHPAVVFFFGGGWRGGSPAQFANQCRYLSSRGVVGIVCDYRVASRHQVKAVSCVEDAKSAIRWVRANAQMLGVNPQQICAAGGSAGGHIACCTGVVPGLDPEGEDLQVSSVPNAMALFNPAVMLASLDGVAEPSAMIQKLAGMKERTGVEPRRISPIHHLSKGQPPTIIFHGIADTTVPYLTVEEFTRRSTALGNDVTLVGYEGAPHGFFNNRGGTSQRGDDSLQWYRGTMEQLDRFLARLGWIDGEPTERRVSDDVRIRRYLDQSRHTFESTGRGRVAFLGGSITEMNGYRPQVESWLQEQFPQTDFDFINAGISSTCSHTGAFRLQRDVLSHGPVDLLLVEFAVNDDQDARHSAEDCMRGMEGIIRQALAASPSMDIVMIHFINDPMLQQLTEGTEPLSSRQHESVARHYGVSSVYLSRVVANAIQSKELTWKDYGGTHPGPQGNTLAAGLVCQLLEAGWRSGCAAREAVPYDLPKPLDATSFAGGRLLSAKDVEMEISGGWQRSVPDWGSLPGSKRSRFTREVMLHTDQPEQTLSFRFDGTAVGAYVLAGPDAGIVEYRIDGGEWQAQDLLHRYSRGLHYPRTVMFATGLAAGGHQLELRTRQPASAERGSAVRILALAVSE